MSNTTMPITEVLAKASKMSYPKKDSKPRKGCEQHYAKKIIDGLDNPCFDFWDWGMWQD